MVKSHVCHHLAEIFIATPSMILRIIIRVRPIALSNVTIQSNTKRLTVLFCDDIRKAFKAVSYGLSKLEFCDTECLFLCYFDFFLKSWLYVWKAKPYVFTSFPNTSEVIQGHTHDPQHFKDYHNDVSDTIKVVRSQRFLNSVFFPIRGTDAFSTTYSSKSWWVMALVSHMEKTLCG